MVQVLGEGVVVLIDEAGGPPSEILDLDCLNIQRVDRDLLIAVGVRWRDIVLLVVGDRDTELRGYIALEGRVSGISNQYGVVEDIVLDRILVLEIDLD